MYDLPFDDVFAYLLLFQHEHRRSSDTAVIWAQASAHLHRVHVHHVSSGFVTRDLLRWFVLVATRCDLHAPLQAREEMNLFVWIFSSCVEW